MLTVVVFGMLAFVTDLGLAYVNRQVVQNGADSAAVAAGQEIALTAEGDQNCTDIAASLSAPMRDVAEDYFDQNVSVDAAVADGEPGFAIGCDDGLITVRVTGEQLSETFFTGVLPEDPEGADTLEDGIAVGGAATAVVGPAGSVTGLRPFAVCRTFAQQLVASPGVNVTIPVDGGDHGCGTNSGNVGWLDFDGSNSVNTLANRFENGYQIPVSSASPQEFGNTPGLKNSSSMEAALNSILGDEIALPVYGSVNAGGFYQITGFIGVKLCGWKIGNKSGRDTCFTTVAAPVPADYLQVHYTRFIPIAELNTSCMLGDPTCDNGLRVFAMGG